MPIVERSALVPYSAAAMFEVVDNINAYSEFLPWCEQSHVIRRGEDWVEARLIVAKAGFRHAFTTRNQLDHANHVIHINLVDGPFRHLRGDWQFLPIDEAASTVKLRLDFELSSRMASLTFGPVFKQISHSLVEAFKKRAQQIYG